MRTCPKITNAEMKHKGAMLENLISCSHHTHVLRLITFIETPLVEILYKVELL